MVSLRCAGSNAYWFLAIVVSGAVSASMAMAELAEGVPQPTLARAVQIASLAPALIDPRSGPEPRSQPDRRSISLEQKWRTTQIGLRNAAERIALCSQTDTGCASDEISRFLTISNAARARSGRAQIGEVNRRVNLSIRPVSDQQQHGVEDAWTDPLTTLRAGRGDCEDYALLKIAVLREIGFAEQDLRLLVVYDMSTRAHHAVAAARFEGRWLLLDNRRMAMMDAADSLYRPLATLQLQAEMNQMVGAQQSAPEMPGAVLAEPLLM